MNSSKTKSEVVKYYILRYIQEIMEAFIAYSILVLIKEKTYNFIKIVKISFILGAVTLFLEEYNEDYKKNIKAGLLTSLCTNVI